VVDEADRLLNQDFNDWLPLLIDAIREIEECRRIAMVRQKYAATRSHITVSLWCYMACHGLRQPRQTQKLLFSATLSRDPVKIASLRLTKPLYVVVTDDTTAIADHEAAEFALPATLKESYMVLDSGIKPLQLAHLTATRDITNALCFTQSTQAAKRLVTLLSLIGEEVPELASKLRTHVFSSDMPLKERSRVLQEFKAGDIKLLVCSDLISRGIDIPHVQHVLNYDAPIDIRKYVHRVGRTARAGQEGSAWTLVEEQQASFFKTLMREAGRLDKLERIRVKEKDLEQLMPGYEVSSSWVGLGDHSKLLFQRALARLKDDYATRQ
jgi:ATP-dependent RNA helicase DDX51/DBP6